MFSGEALATDGDSVTMRRARAVRIAGGILVVQGLGLVATLAISRWSLQHVNEMVAEAVSGLPTFADQASHVRAEVTAFHQNLVAYAAITAPLFLLFGARLWLRPSIVPRIGVAALATFAVAGCIATGLLNVMSLSGNEPLLEAVKAPGPMGATAELVALNWVIAPVTATVAAALLSAASKWNAGPMAGG